jgi:hypothetical protein
MLSLLLLLQVVALYQFVQPGDPIPRGCVLDEGAFRQGLPAEVRLAPFYLPAAVASLLLLLLLHPCCSRYPVSMP